MAEIGSGHLRRREQIGKAARAPVGRLDGHQNRDPELQRLREFQIRQWQNGTLKCEVGRPVPGSRQVRESQSVNGRMGLADVNLGSLRQVVFSVAVPLEAGLPYQLAASRHLACSRTMRRTPSSSLSR